jgi:hypothetical protein
MLLWMGLLTRMQVQLIPFRTNCPNASKHRPSPVLPRGTATTPLLHSCQHQSFCHDPRYCAAIQQWRSDNNHIMQYLAERVYEAPDGSISVQDMYDDYRNWFASTGLRGQLGRKQFANRVESAGVTKSSRRSKGYFFENVSLR